MSNFWGSVQMMTFAEDANLRYVGDAEARIECPEYYHLADNEEFLKLQSSATSVIAEQQYLDFAVGRSFRKSLFTLSQHPQQAYARPDFSRLADLLFAGAFEAIEGESATQSKSYQIFDKQIHIDCPITQEMLALLNQSWPRPVSGRDLLRLGSAKSKAQAERALKQLYMYFPLEMSRSYEDLPECLQDMYSGLIPGAALLMTARHQGKSSIAEFNAWYSSSTANIEASELFVVNELEATRSPLRVADALEQAWEAGNYLPEASELRKKIKENMEGYAMQYVQEVIDRLHKYAIYV